MTYELEKLAVKLKAARREKGLSQRGLSDLAGVPQSHISKIETGRVNLTVSSLTAIANALDLEIALVPRQAMPAVKAFARTTGSRAGIEDIAKPEPRPAYSLDDDDDA
jgi:transcriptional regulator with XRE-family HTH domain